MDRSRTTEFRGKVKALIQRIKASNLAGDALKLFFWNVVSKAILFFGNAYAAKCLGPINLGISAQVQALSQQVALAYNGGFDFVAVRTIAADGKTTPAVVEAITLFRLGIAILLASVWLSIVVWVHEPGPNRFAWMLGAALLLIGSLNITFLFQAIGKLPLQAAISGCGSVIIAGIYAVYFVPGMRVGSDLIVIALVTSISTIVAFWYCTKLLNLRSWRRISVVDALQELKTLIKQSWRYWLLAVAGYLYNIFPILLVAYFHGDRAAGIYRAAFLMATAMELLFGSINNLILPKFVSWYKEGARILWGKQSELMFLNMLIGLAVGATAILCSNFVFDVLLGEQFVGGSEIFQIMVLARVVVFVGQIYAYGLVAIRLDSYLLSASLAGAIASVPLGFLLIPKFSLYGAAFVNLTSEIIVLTLCYFLERGHVFKTK